MDNLGDLQPRGEMRRGIAPFVGKPTILSTENGGISHINWPVQKIGSVGDINMSLTMYSEEEVRNDFSEAEQAVTFDNNGNVVSLGKMRAALKNGYGTVCGYITPRIGQSDQIGEDQQIELGINPETSVTTTVESGITESGQDFITFYYPDLTGDDISFVLKNDPELLSRIRLNITSKPKGGE